LSEKVMLGVLKGVTNIIFWDKSASSDFYLRGKTVVLDVCLK
jgi:hypothetical protein